MFFLPYAETNFFYTLMSMSSFFVELCITISAVLVVIVIITIITLTIFTVSFKYSKQLKNKGTFYTWAFYYSEWYPFEVVFLYLQIIVFHCNNRSDIPKSHNRLLNSYNILYRWSHLICMWLFVHWIGKNINICYGQFHTV